MRTLLGNSSYGRSGTVEGTVEGGDCLDENATSIHIHRPDQKNAMLAYVTVELY